LTALAETMAIAVGVLKIDCIKTLKGYNPLMIEAL
jgi:hypothetical protein